MFNAEEIQARLRQKPYIPLRIIASEGLKYDITHPDLVFVGRHYLQIGYPDPVTPTIYNGVAYVALVHIVALEELPIPVGSQAMGGNGPTA